MNYFYFVLFIICSILLISFSFEDDEFNPIPENNGILNEQYNHYRNIEDNLFFIFLNFRHGARSPIYFKSNKTDMLGGKWHNKGELTYLGKRQQYEIGLKNRERYSNFISEEYDPKEVKIYSTYFDRTINSIQSQLMGLYSNISYNEYNFSDFNNTNIFNNTDNDIEYVNRIIPPIKLFENLNNGKNNLNKNIYEKTFKNHFDCPYLREQVFKNLNESNKEMDSLIDSFNNEYYDILIKEYKNINKQKIKTQRGFYKFCDVYLSIYPDKNNNHVLNKITKYGKNITKIKEICDDYLYKHFMYIRNGGHANRNAIISQSPTIRKIIDWMQVRADQNNNFAAKYSEPKLVLYSGHDSTLFEIQSLLKKAFNIEYEYTPFASTQLFELRKYGDLFYVEIYYNDRLKMNITFEEFKNRIESIIMSDKDIYNICYIKKTEIYLRNEKIFLIFIIICLIIIIILIFWKINIENNANINIDNKVIQIDIQND